MQPTAEVVHAVIAVILKQQVFLPLIIVTAWVSSSGSDMSAIGSSRDNFAGTSSGGSSGSRISHAKANDGFNAAQDNTRYR